MPEITPYLVTGALILAFLGAVYWLTITDETADAIREAFAANHANGDA